VRGWIVPPGSRREKALGLARAAPAAVAGSPATAVAAPVREDDTALAAAIAQARQGARVEPSPEQPPRPDRPPRVALLTNRLLDWTTREPRFGVGEAFHEATRAHDHVLYAMPNYGSGPMREDAVLVCHGIWFDHDLLPPPYTFRTPEWFEHLYRVFSRPRKVVSVDTNSINVVRSLWPEVAARLTYIPNAVDTRAFKPPASRAAGPSTVLFPRRMDVIRGSRILGAILDGVPHRWRMRWVGDGDGEEPEVVRAVAQHDSRVEIVSASFDQMPSLYQEAEICVIPSVASEGTSLACLEGLASGCAVVATNVGGLPALIQPGVNGLLVDPEPGAIAEAIRFLIDHPQERHRLQKAGRETAHAFRLELWEERWTALLERLGWLAGVHALARAEAL
jgi:glycosyltransferase involved in cell wall biosynthesis